jgi:predicted nucleotide-binding protein
MDFLDPNNRFPLPPIPGANESPLENFSVIGQAAQISPAQPATLEKSIVQKLQDIITLGRKLSDNNKKPSKEALVQKIRQIRFLLCSFFGKDTAIVKNADLFVKEANTKGLSTDQFVQILSDVEFFLDFIGKTGASPLSCQVSQVSRVPSTKNVFVIHGHDELNTRRLTELLQNHFKLNPIAMLSKPGMSRPLIEKFEDEAQSCSFAFGLFTPDDEIVNAANRYKQARPNVIYEVGWFIGRLGKHRVALLLKQGTNIHSDLDGVSRIPFSDNVEDKFLDIQKELKAAKIIS